MGRPKIARIAVESLRILARRVAAVSVAAVSVAAVSVAAVSVVACGAGEGERPPPLDGTFGERPTLPECEPPPTPDTTEVCSAETVELLGRKPTLYFILDTSGSMLDYIPEGGDTKLDAAKSALTTVVKEIGHHVKYGLATFPGDDTEVEIRGCASGTEIFEVQEGDELACVNLPPSGPVYASFARKLSRITANGGTPLSPTLNSLKPSLLAREDETAVILITDGAPNCNADYFCEASDCVFNRYGVTRVVSGEELPCEGTTNCCSEDDTGSPDAHLQCIDQPASVSEVEALSAAGIPTYVIGVLGNEDFDDVMNHLAEAGGRARQGARKYYDVESLAELTDAVRAIGLDLTRSCEIELVQPPIYEDQFNVYFDSELVPSNQENGFTLVDGVVTLHGEACDTVESGAVEQIHLLSGCRTVVR